MDLGPKVATTLSGELRQHLYQRPVQVVIDVDISNFWQIYIGHREFS